MTLDERGAGPPRGTGSRNNHLNDDRDRDDGASTSTTLRRGGIGSVERTLGCPCGCSSRWLSPAYLGYWLDPECVVAQPLGDQIDYDDAPVGYMRGGRPWATSVRTWRRCA